MANQSKVYHIEIQMDAARQQLADTTKKLAELDKSLDGMDRNSDAAKAIVQQMAKLAAEVESAESQVDGLNESLDALKPGTIPALEAEIEELEAALRRTVIGTQEQEEALLKLGNAKGELKKLEDAVDALSDVKQHAAAFVDFANGVVGAFSVATVAAESFGLSSSTAEEYQKKLLSLIAVLDGVEQVSRALNSETLAVVKSTWASAKGWLGVGEAATTSGKMTRTALAASGVGLILVLVGLLVANWDKLTSSVKGSFSWFEKVKAVASGLFDGLIAGAKSAGTILADLFTGDTAGAIQEANNFGKKVGAAYVQGYQDSLFEGYKKVIQSQLDQNERFVKILQAKGKDTYELEKRNLEDRILLAQNGTEEEKKARLDLIGDLATLNAAHHKKEFDQQRAADLARLNSSAALEQAKGNEAFQKQLTAKRQELQQLLTAAQQDNAAILAKRGEIDTMLAAHQVQEAEKRRAAQAKEDQQALSMLDLAGQDTLSMRVAQAKARLDANKQTSDKERELYQEDLRAYKLVLEEQRQFEITLENERRQDREADHYAEVEDQDRFKAGAMSGAQEVSDKYAALAKRPIDFGRSILENVFGVRPDQVEQVKQVINDAYASIQNSVSEMTQGLLGAAQEQAEAALSAAQTKLDEVSSQLDAAKSKRESDEDALKTATGARRDYLIGKIQKERAEEEKLAAQKVKAAKQEEAAAKEKARLEKEQQKITAASTFAASAYNAVLAVQAALNAVEKGAELPPPASFIAIAAGVAAVAAAVVAARNLGKQLGDGGTLGDGGEIVGGSHASGNDVPVLGGRYRVEGGEMITPVDATQNNRAVLELIRTQGRKRTLLPADFARAAGYRVLPPPMTRPQGSFGDGGVLPSGSPASAGMSGGTSLDELALRIEQSNALLALIASYGPARLAIGPGEALAIDEQKQVAQQSKSVATL